MIRDSLNEDLSLKMVRVGDALLRAGRVAEAAAVYRRAARSFEEESRLSHARASWRLVLKASPGDEEACHHIVNLGGLPTTPDKRTGYGTRVQLLTAEEVEGTAVGEELAEITDAGFRDVEPSMRTEIYHQPEQTAVTAKSAPAGLREEAEPVPLRAPRAGLREEAEPVPLRAPRAGLREEAEPSVTVERPTEATIPGAPPPQSQRQPAVGLIRPLPSRIKRKPETTRLSVQAAVFFDDPEFTATSQEHSLTPFG